jgi:hypothetical protein
LKPTYTIKPAYAKLVVTHTKRFRHSVLSLYSRSGGLMKIYEGTLAMDVRETGLPCQPHARRAPLIFVILC